MSATSSEGRRQTLVELREQLRRLGEQERSMRKAAEAHRLAARQIESRDHDAAVLTNQRDERELLRAAAILRGLQRQKDWTEEQARRFEALTRPTALERTNASSTITSTPGHDRHLDPATEPFLRVPETALTPRSRDEVRKQELNAALGLMALRGAQAKQVHVRQFEEAEAKRRDAARRREAQAEEASRRKLLADIERQEQALAQAEANALDAEEEHLQIVSSRRPARRSNSMKLRTLSEERVASERSRLEAEVRRLQTANVNARMTKKQSDAHRLDRRMQRHGSRVRSLSEHARLQRAETAHQRIERIRSMADRLAPQDDCNPS